MEIRGCGGEEGITFRTLRKFGQEHISDGMLINCEMAVIEIKVIGIRVILLYQAHCQSCVRAHTTM